MFDPPNDDRVITDLAGWGEDSDRVRAMILTSTRANPEASVDLFSDYDVIVAVPDVREFYEDRTWLEHFGRVLVVYRDPMTASKWGPRFAYITQYESGLKIDFSVWSVEILKGLEREVELPDELDVGYAVLLDKDGLTEGLPPATRKAHVPSPPSPEAYREAVEEFFHEATYVAKHLWRDELLPAKYNFDHAMKQVNLRRMLEWRIEAEHGWSVRPGAYGRGLRRRLPADIWRELERTYAGAGVRENWDALFLTVDLFQRVAVEVADCLGFRYPSELEGRVRRYLAEVRQLQRPGS
jgi:aminoglycoside 6-adenylyltransferase